MKKILKILLMIVLAAVLLFLAGRYGWRALGYSVCDDPDTNFVETVTVEAASVHIVGGTAGSFSSYVGNIHELSGGCLYVGIKHNGFLGFLQRLGSFSLTIPTDGQTVTAIYFKGNNEERLIWTQENGVIRTPAVSNSQSEAAPKDIVQASYPFANVDGENALCAVLFLGYDEASADDAVARLCSEYAVIHELFLSGDVVTFDAQGGEQYLILPKYVGTTVTVTEVQMDENGVLQPASDPLATEAPLRVLCNYSDIMPSAQITVQYGTRSIIFSPFISLKDGGISEIDGAYTAMMHE